MLRGLIIAATIFAIWEFCCVYFSLPPFMLPPPSKIFMSIYTNWDLLLKHASYTLVEILASIFIGVLFPEASSAYKGCFPFISFLFVINEFSPK